jgi:hypothetical protein
MKTKFNPRFVVLLLLIVGAASTRFFSVDGHSPLINFTPIGAMALFGGAYFTQKWKSFLFPLLTLFISDIIILSLFYHGQFGLMYKGWFFVYGVFALIVFLGRWLLQNINIKNVLIAGITASLAHWLIADFGVWLCGGLDITTGLPYTLDISGLLKCYYLALPYLKDFFLGTVIYSAIMFGIFEFAQRRFPVLSVQ